MEYTQNFVDSASKGQHKFCW